MKISRFEIDFLNVEDADAILIHFYDEHDNNYVVAIDAGRYGDGDTVSKFVKDHYHTNVIDLAICTHCDDDHYGGFIKMLEEQKKNLYKGIKINSFMINDPGKYATADDYKYYRLNANVKDKAREVYDVENDKNLIEMIDELKIKRTEALSWGGNNDYSFFDGVFEILAPTQSYYQSLVPSLRNDLIPYDTTDSDTDDTSLCYGQCLSPKLDATPDDTSSHNRSSVIVMFKPNPTDKFIFMGDASESSFNGMIPSDRDKMKNATLLKVPHHGSHHNLSSSIINLINPKFAIVSAKSTKKYFSPRVKFALKKKGALVCSTHINGSLWFHHGIDGREDEYGPASFL